MDNFLVVLLLTMSTKKQKVKSIRQVRYLLSSGSPLSASAKDTLKHELKSHIVITKKK